MLSLIGFAPRSPTNHIARIPYEVLQEIFTHCLLRYRRPSAKTAPILLCHVCSSWRQLALASTTLWTHLSYGFKVQMYDRFDSTSWTIEFKDRDIEFIWWWKMNHGHVAPYLSFRVNMSYSRYRRKKPVKRDLEFLLDYITSAQHLDFDLFFWSLVLEIQQTGHPLCFPYLHTALAEHSCSGNNPLRELQILLLPETIPVLRCLSFSEVRVPSSDFTPPTHWAALTHISLHYVLPLLLWHTLIRALPRLQWGHFDLTPTPPFDVTHGTFSRQFVLPELSTLSIVICRTFAHGDVFPFSFFFTALHFPTLRNFSLSAPGVYAWENAHTISELYTTLGSAPAIEKLTLEDISNTIHDSNLPRAIQATTPVWAHTPHLVHIQLSLPPTPPHIIPHHTELNHGLSSFVRRIFSSKWLDLRNPASPVRKVTIAINNKGALHWARDVTMANVTECMSEAQGVVLEFTEFSGLIGADMRMEWGARI